MKIDLGYYELEFFFHHCQIEITGKCNMNCEHCRASNGPHLDMSLNLFKKCIDFVISEARKDFRLTISGGEPFLHKDLIKMIKYAKNKGVEYIIVTTNGSAVTLKKLRDLKKIDVKNLGVQISVDSANPKEHDRFRNFKGAFDLAMKAFDLTKDVGLVSSLRASIVPSRIIQIEKLVRLAIKKGAKRIGIGSIIPAGMGKENRMLLMNKKQKKEFLEKIAEMERKYSKIKVTTEDPLKFSLKNCPWGYGNFNITREGFYGGCTAGVAGFNVDCKGVITPCAVLLKKITNLNKYSIKDAKKKYVSSNIIKNLFKRNLKGKCGICELKKLCGGCRAVAEGINKDYLGEDTTCFYKRD